MPAAAIRRSAGIGPAIAAGIMALYNGGIQFVRSIMAAFP